MCAKKKRKKCKFLGSLLCNLLKKQCVREDSNGCSLWELSLSVKPHKLSKI